MSTDTDQPLEMTDWQAHQFSQSKYWFALGSCSFGAVLYFIGVPLVETGNQIIPATFALILLLFGELMILAYEDDGRARKLADWLFRKFGEDDYPWAAHDVEVTYRDE